MPRATNWMHFRALHHAISLCYLSETRTQCVQTFAGSISCYRMDQDFRLGRSAKWLGTIVAIILSLAVVGQSRIVQTKFGTIHGFWGRSSKGNLTACYLGVPYAEPPIGDLRFRNPQPWTRKWNATYNATVDGNKCIQPDHKGQIVGSEDCLYLNIFTPVLTDKRGRRKKLPVLVFVHGGKYIFGSSDSQTFYPENLMDQNVVFVTLNYRLNIMGFFTTESKVAPGNYGLKDIVMALRWVQENIEVFNGDPNSVTLLGHSAGAAAVHILSFNKNTEGLFHRYILMSGTIFSPWNINPKNRLRETSFDAAEVLDCLPQGIENSTVELQDEECEWYCPEDRRASKLEEKMLSCMRSLDAKTIGSVLKKYVRASNIFRIFTRPSHNGMYIWRGNPCCFFGPVIEEESDEAVLTADPWTTIKKRQFRDLPCIVGVVKDEGLVKMIDIMDALDELKDNFNDYILILTEQHNRPSGRDEFVSAVKEFYFASNVSALSIENVTQVTTDSLTMWPVYQMARHQFPVMKSSTFLYFFKYEGTFSNTFSYSPIYYGVSHGDELEYLMPALCKEYKTLQRTEADVTMSNIMTEMWARFAATGVPESSKTIPWPDYKHAHEFLVIGKGKEPEITVDNNFLPVRMLFWTEMMNETDWIEDEEEQEEFKPPSCPVEKFDSDSGHDYNNVLVFLNILAMKERDVCDAKVNQTPLPSHTHTHAVEAPKDTRMNK